MHTSRRARVVQMTSQKPCEHLNEYICAMSTQYFSYIIFIMNVQMKTVKKWGGHCFMVAVV